jgi:hypothetical protein
MGGIMDKDSLHEELNALSPDERTLLLSDKDLSVDEKLRYAALVVRLKSTLPNPSIYAVPLTRF